ncbi:MAG: hypothetical protein AB4372_29315 [Xenococcus sp. (in: cyanobacteria)]
MSKKKDSKHQSQVFGAGISGQIIGNRNIRIKNGNYNEKIEGNYIEHNYYAEYQQQNLREVATEIQALLEQLAQSYPHNTTIDKMTIATEAIQKIDHNPSLSKKIFNALKINDAAALEELLNHPAASLFISALEDWQQYQ